MFIFDDDLFTFDKEWLAEFSKAYRKATRIGFVCNAHVRMFDEETASLSERGGLQDREVRRRERKRQDTARRAPQVHDKPDIEDAFGAAHKFGLHTSAFVMIGLPGEEKADVMETIRLLSRVRPGRFRWSLFFPFIGTKAYEIAAGAGAIDLRKMAALDNFTDETCMDLGEEVNLLVSKVKDTFCAFVNGYAAIPEYEGIVSEIESLGEEAWEEGERGSPEEDRADRRSIWLRQGSSITG